MASVVGMLVMAMVPLTSPSAPAGQCSQQQMRNIMGGGGTPCMPRATMVQLQVDDPSLQVVAPSHVEVMRCGGSCPLAALSCLPVHQTSVQKEISTVFSRVSLTPGPSPTVCDTVQVEEHTACECKCHLGPSSCPSSSHTFLPYECRCVCRQEEGRGACLARGWEWDATSCSCLCPGRPYSSCPSGYVFDYQTSCTCIPIHLKGSFTQLEVTLVILAGSCLLIVVSVGQCYRKSVGLFRHRRAGVGRRGQLRQDVDSLITRFDHIRMTKVDEGDTREDSPTDGDTLARHTRGISL